MTALSRLALRMSVLLGLAACKTSHQPGQALDDLARGLEEYGTATISTPILSLPDERFAFDLGNRGGAGRYFDDARSQIQGAAAAFIQQVQSLAVSAGAQWDPTVAAAYADQLQRYLHDRGLEHNRDQLMSEAALVEYEAAIRAAESIEDPVKKAAAIADAKRKYADALPKPRSPDGQYPTPASMPAPPTGAPPGPDEARKALANGGTFAAAGKLLGDSRPSLSVPNRSALITAAGDSAVEAIFKILGRPAEAQEFTGKTLVFGVGTVAIAPGWRTRKGFAADVSMNVEVDLRPAKPQVIADLAKDRRLKDAQKRLLTSISDGTRGSSPHQLGTSEAELLRESLPADWWVDWPAQPTPWQGRKGIPLVAVVSPMTEVQTLELASSRRNRTELALSLAIALRLAGFGGNLQVLEQFVKQYETDVATRTPEGIVTAYSAGSVFGYQIGPTLKALEDPAADEPAPAHELDRQSFPFLIILGLDTEELHPYLVKQGSGVRIYEPYLRFTQVARWVPQTECAARHRLQETRRVGWMKAMSEPEDEIASRPSSGAAHLLHERSAILGSLGVGSFSRVFLPEEVISRGSHPPKVTQVVPDVIDFPDVGARQGATKSIRLTLLGTKLDQVDDLLIAAGSASLNGEVRLRGGAIHADLEVTGSESPILLAISSRGHVSVTPPIRVRGARVPRVTDVFPKSVTLDARDGTPVARDVTVIVLGEGLAAVDARRVTIAQGDAEVVNASLKSGALRATVKFRSGREPVVLALGLETTDSDTREVLSLPILVSVSAPPAPDATTMTYRHVQGDEIETHEVKVSPKASAGAVDSSREIIKAQVEKGRNDAAPDEPSSASVDLHIQAGKDPRKKE